MKVTVELDGLLLLWLRELIGDEYPTIEAVLEHLAGTTAEGIRREGSWEAQFVAMAFGNVDYGWPEFADALGHAEAWHRPKPAGEVDPKYPPGWIGRVVRGDCTVAYDSAPFDSEAAALQDAQQWLADSELTPVEEVLKERYPYGEFAPVLQ